MKLTFVYTPEGEAESWRVGFNPERPRLTAGEAVWLERHMDNTPITDIFEASGAGSMTAMLAILFIYRKRDEPTLRYGDFEDSIVTDDISVEMDDEAKKMVQPEPVPKDSSAEENDKPSPSNS